MFNENAKAGGVFTVQCIGQDGNLKWETEFPNLVVNEGLQDMNNRYFKGSSYTAAWYMGLVEGPGSGTSFAATDTLASHPGWTEFTNYSGGVRPQITFGTPTTADPSVATNSSSPTAFSISSSGGVVAGAFVCAATSGTSGVLFSAADFESPGDRTVVSGDTLNVTYTFSLNAA